MVVISLGGSIVSPKEVDAPFLSDFRKLILDYVDESGEKLVIVTGGGAPARRYQAAFREIVPEGSAEDQDWIGVAATRLNAALVKAVFGEYCSDPVVTDPTEPESITGMILVGAGWKPGFSSDYDAVVLARRLGARLIINLSNTDGIYDSDPRKNPDAKPIERLSWQELQELVGNEWIPGSNVPFDPVATKAAAEYGAPLVAAEGRDLPNLRSILRGEPFKGSRVE